MPLDTEILGLGVYSPRQAARLVGSSAQEVLRWTRGSGPAEPLWNAEYQYLDDTSELSFLDLVEVRVVRQLREAGVPLQSIRFAIKYSEEVLGISRPLSSLAFKTDGKEVLVDALEADGDFLSLAKKRPGQKVFSRIIEQTLRDLEYEDGRVARWRPAATKSVILDPTRQFGDPILDQFGVSTAMLAAEHMGGNSISALSILYEIPKGDVRAAVEFERKLDRAVGQGSV